jgi:Na+/H+ antiporter NhaC
MYEQFMIYFTIAGLAFLLLVYAISSNNKNKQASNQTQTQQPEPKTSKHMTPEELLKVLDWMVQCNIIDIPQYNKLVAKSIPYIG